jgi:hypothetical protein
MNPNTRRLLDQIAGLKHELAIELHKPAEEGHFRVTGSRVEFTPSRREEHRQAKLSAWQWLRQVRPRAVLALPFIYGMFCSLLLLDITISLYQAISFPLYGIAKVRRRDYLVFDRSHLAYLNLFEKFNCFYCSYANGLFAYCSEITARTEQYFCPIKHALPVPGAHSRYPHFLDYGDATDYQARAERLRRDLAEEAGRPR